ncbi:hypothetical protein ACHAWF_018945 [Thalassiosira exigua]
MPGRGVTSESEGKGNSPGDASLATKPRKKGLPQRIVFVIVASLTVLNLIPPSVYLDLEEEMISPIPMEGRKEHHEKFPLERCPVPKCTMTWRYYDALVDENAKLGLRATELTENSTAQQITTGGARIPHRLVFTHKGDLFDCLNSTSTPELHTLAENAKATVRAYRKLWPDFQYVFLTDEDCLDAISRVEPRLIPWFNSGKNRGKNTGLPGSWMADMCRAAYLYLHDGYYCDVDVLVVHPYLAPKGATFVTVKASAFQRYGFFQAFLAAEKDSEFLLLSLKIMLAGLWEERKKGRLLGPWATIEAVKEMLNTTDVRGLQNGQNGVHLLTEVELRGKRGVPAQYTKLPKQHPPQKFAVENCTFSLCNYVVVNDEGERVRSFSGGITRL